MTRLRGRGRLSSIELLPPECDAVIAWAAQELAGRDKTQTEIYAEFVSKCEELIREHRGEIDFAVPSFSSFNRYALRLATMTRRLEETREIAATMAARFDPQGSDDLTRIAAEAIKTLVFEIVTTAGEAGVGTKGAMELANALRAAAAAQGVSTDRRQRLEKEFAKDVGEAVDKVAKAKGLTAETVEEIKAQILGVKG
ncbi:DUF3486 family protein [Frigidibacter oleivorans]|uniref:DUF3486 family protein n=1 Tax=Frigidibacter oleivorans TaxID=2487129 RepID=UPI000F8F651B|nr:DUF3486 family protein [Frigidibacter oleivorans]